MSVPITPAVLDWAIAESGYSRSELAASANIDALSLERWITGEEKPGLSDVRRIASKLHRQVATFLLPLPPEAERTAVQFRHPLGARASRALTPVERRFVRRARRLQEAQAWLIGELGWDKPALRQMSTGESADAAATLFRADLRVNSLFVSAVQSDIISQSQALDYLDIPSEAFGRLAAGTPAS